MKKFLLLIDGPMGAGKTTVSKLIFVELKNTAHIGLDRIKWLVSGFRRTLKQNMIARTVVMAMARIYLTQGVSVILEHAMKKEEVKVYQRLARAKKAKFLMYRLDAPKNLLFKRAQKRTPVPGRPKVTRSRIIRNYRIYTKSKREGVTILDSKKLTAKQIASHILKDLGKA